VETVTVRGCFVAIGHNRNTDIFKDKLEMKEGYFLTLAGRNGSSTQTSIPEVFAAGGGQD
jgi:thioredoxin reductase (NADPH)